MSSQEKELRNKIIVDLHNSGSSIREISKLVSMSIGGVSKVIASAIGKGDAPERDNVVEVKLTGQEERFVSFVGYERTNKNEYVHKDTGEIVNVVFVKSTELGKFGYFVKVKSDSEKSTASGIDDVIKTAEENLANGIGVKL